MVTVPAQCPKIGSGKNEKNSSNVDLHPTSSTVLSVKHVKVKIFKDFLMIFIKVRFGFG